MATYKHLRSSTANKRPTTSITDGQLAINTNTASPGLFFKDSAGTGIVKVGPVHVGTTAPNATPAAGGSSGNYLGEQWLDTSVSPAQMKVWNGSAWVGIVADELPVSKLQDGDARQLLQTDAAGTGVEWTSNVDVPGTLDVTSTATFDSIARHPLGSAAAPTLTFTGDLNTGIYSPGADQVAVSTGGALRITVDASGRLLVGTSSARSNFFNTASSAPQQLQVEGTTGNTCSLSSICSVADTSGGRLLLAHQRSGAVGGNTILNSGDQAGYITFQGNDGGEFVECASIEAQVDGTPGANDMPGRLVFSTTADGGSSPSERLRITSAGLVGIGTSSPKSLLNLSASTAPILTLESTDTTLTTNDVFGQIDFYANDGSTNGTGAKCNIKAIATSTAGTATALVFSTADSGTSTGTEKVRIDAAGNVGIGTTSVSSKLHVLNPSGGSGTTEVSTIERDNSGYFLKLYRNAGSGNAGGLLGADSEGTYFTGGHNTSNQLYINSANSAMQFYTSGSERGRFDASGRLLVGTSSARSNVYIGGSSTTPLIQSETSGSTYNNGASLLTYSTVNYAPILTLGTSNSDTAGTNTAVGINYVLGIINFAGNDGTNFRSGAWISAAVDGSVSTGDLPTRLTFSTTADGASSPTERMRIGSNGQIQMGRTAPVGNERLALQNSIGPCGYFFQGGNIPEDVLELRNTYNQSGQTATYIRFSDSSGTTRGSITATTSATSYNTSSDYRLKENVTPVSDGISRLKQLKPNRFNFIVDPDTVVDGFLAHEVQTIVPEAITGEKDAVDDDGNPVYQGIDQSKLVPLLTAALQEAIGEIETLQGMVAVNNITIDEQEHQISALAARLTALESA
jgi:hypothetical protein